jgi:hypothetical protein
VQMLPRNHYGERDIRRQGQADDEPNRRRGHAHVIMATETTLRQTSLGLLHGLTRGTRAARSRNAGDSLRHTS